ncbi:MAG: nitroreductase family protein [Candidatus Bathyarchaeota archaeon]|nr:nitroreductase family protein [Candidatus Bathyarchaeota archaeon]
MNVYEAIQTRRSVRKYKPGPVTDEDLKKILTAAQLAPSAGNKQPWRFIVVRDTEKIKKLAEIASKQMWIADAGVVIACLAVDKKSPEVYERWVERDVMSAVEHMVLTAWDLGYGTCWIGAFKQTDVKEYLGIPEKMTVINLLPIGIPGHKPEARGRKSFEELFHGEEYGKALDL